MSVKKINRRNISLTLLRESIWGLEDNVKVMIDQLTEIESVVIQQRRMNAELSKRFDKLELNQTKRQNGISK